MTVDRCTARNLLGLAALAMACGRGPILPPAGTAGGPCYGNGTCDADLVCSREERCVSAELLTCVGVTCAGHGRCQMTVDGPTCVCDSGYRAVGLTCAPCANSECGGRCPAEMVFVPMGLDGVCMDGVEASLFANPDCTGTRYGVEAFDDLPASFPDFVACHECDPDWNTQPLVEPTAELYACSVPGLRPAGFVSWFQAQRACENVGKHLCDMFALETACRGPSGYDYPYGPTFVEDACNTEESWLGSPVPTGNASCEGGFAGLFDLVGNVIEWTTYGSATNQPTYFGGSFDWADPTCSLTAQSMFSADELTDIGFRCCRVP